MITTLHSVGIFNKSDVIYPKKDISEEIGNNQFEKNKNRLIEKIKINLKKVKAGKIPDLELEPGDRIHVPQSWF